MAEHIHHTQSPGIQRMTCGIIGNDRRSKKRPYTLGRECVTKQLEQAESCMNRYVVLYITWLLSESRVHIYGRFTSNG